VSTEGFQLRLYVTGATARSQKAVANARRFCDETLPAGSQLEVIDLYERPAEATAAQVIAAPTLVRVHPLPQRRLVGDLSDSSRLRAVLHVN
jgi:circadian clock protein KaiB